ncbi:hypothetical protein [Paraburkholderia sp. J41]|uniref:hypothetical protein n=1 Tax=Paraburkholderia sp. J41 TaxID=2805433 RepID=UPI002AC34F41|nr:hypothetical protein [Paraburkholderia sp. J41]
MTSPIGSSSTKFTPLNPPTNPRNANPTPAGTATGTPAQPETVHPATPVGPLGHNINTTA